MLWCVLLNVVDEPVKKMTAVVRASTGLRMELNGEHRVFLESDARHCPIVQVLVRDFDVRLPLQ